MFASRGISPINLETFAYRDPHIEPDNAVDFNQLSQIAESDEPGIHMAFLKEDATPSIFQPGIQNLLAESHSWR